MTMASIHIHRLDIVMQRIRAVGGGAAKYMTDVLERCMTQDLWPLWLEHISLQDHSLEDLRNLGHPYSVRYGINSFVHADDEVHTQSGELIAQSRVDSMMTPQGPAIRLTNTSPHYIFLRYGTSKMRMRDPGGAALRDALPAIRRRLAEEVRHAIIQLYTG